MAMTEPDERSVVVSAAARAAEALAGGERAGRLGSALARLARDLVDAHRQRAIFRRENAALRAQLARLEGGREAPSAAHSQGSVSRGSRDGA
jgi:hypothetical protein